MGLLFLILVSGLSLALLGQLVCVGTVVLLGVEGVTDVAKRGGMGTIELYETLRLSHRGLGVAIVVMGGLVAMTSSGRPRMCLVVVAPLLAVAVASHRMSLGSRYNKYDMHTLHCRPPRAWPPLVYVLMLTACDCWCFGVCFAVALGGAVWYLLHCLPEQIPPKEGLPAIRKLLVSLLDVVALSSEEARRQQRGGAKQRAK